MNRDSFFFNPVVLFSTRDVAAFSAIQLYLNFQKSFRSAFLGAKKQNIAGLWNQVLDLGANNAVKEFLNIQKQSQNVSIVEVI